MKTTILILDLDGVLITTPPWKADELDADGYSKFNEDCFNNLRSLTVSVFRHINHYKNTIASLNYFRRCFRCPHLLSKNHNLNKILSIKPFQIWLSSTRRTMKTLEEFNSIFTYRAIKEPITRFLPVYQNCKNRMEEVSRFIEESGITDFLIIDDDKSLNGLSDNNKKRLISTDLQKGFSRDKLNLAIEIIRN